MNVQIQSVKFDADKRLVEFVENKMDKLDRFAERSTGAEVILRLDKDFEKGNKIATVTLHMPGEDLVACHQVFARHMECDRCYLVSLFKVFIESENDLGTRRTLCEAVEFVHLVLDEFDQPFVGVEFHGLNLYVHSLTVYKS